MYLLREAAASKEINLQRLLLFILLYLIVSTFLVSKADDSVVILLVFNEKKLNPHPSRVQPSFQVYSSSSAMNEKPISKNYKGYQINGYDRLNLFYLSLFFKQFKPNGIHFGIQKLQ